MNNFGDVLRGLGSVLNPQVMQSMEAEDARKQALQQQFQMLAVKNQMEQQTPEYQAKLEALKNEKLFRDEAGAANGDITKIAAAASKYGKPEIAAQLFAGQESRAARAQQASEALQARIMQSEQLHEQRMARLQTDAEKAAEAARHNTAMEWLKQQQVEAQKVYQQLIGSIRQQSAESGGAGKAPSGYRWRQDRPGVLEPIPGGPATVQTPEAAAKTELLANGIADVGRFRDLVLKDGKVNRALLAGMAVPGGGVPGTDSRMAYSYIYNAVEAKLRAESGAAVPETEVRRMAARFVPSPLDNDATIESKVSRLSDFLGGSLGRVKPTGVPANPTASDKDDPLGIRQ